LKNIDDNVDVNKTREIIRENIKRGLLLRGSSDRGMKLTHLYQVLS